MRGDMTAVPGELPAVTAVHSYYSSASISGENVAYDLQISALRSAGYHIRTIERRTDVEARSSLFPIKSVMRVATGWDPDPVPSGDMDPTSLLYVHNPFPNFGARQLVRWQGPVVVVAHNFRSICANGLLFRDGEVCTLCPDGTRASALRHRCYRDSLIATVPIAMGSGRPFSTRSLYGRADRVVVQSRHAAQVFAAAGLPNERMALIPGFVEEPVSWAPRRPNAKKWIAVGRLSEEKGFVSLASLWSQWCGGDSLDIVGDGPQMGMIAEAGRGRIRMLGRRDRAWVLEALPDYAGLVFPGRCIEGAHPLVLREAVARGVPVVVAATGTSAEEVARDMDAGVVYDPAVGDSLAKALEAVRDGGLDLRSRARAAYETHFTQKAWLAATTTVFHAAVATIGAGR